MLKKVKLTFILNSNCDLYSVMYRYEDENPTGIIFGVGIWMGTTSLLQISVGTETLNFSSCLDRDGSHSPTLMNSLSASSLRS